MALASPLLDSRNIQGAKKILLSIISGEQAELQMDELTEITEYIQEQAGDEAEVIFGHGVDPGLDDSIRVTVIATGFDKKDEEPMEEGDDRRVIPLETTKQIHLFENDNSVNESSQEPMVKKVEPPVESRGYSFTSPVNDSMAENEGEEGLFSPWDDDLDFAAEEKTGEVNNEPTLSTNNDTRERLLKQARERIEKLRGLSHREITADEFKEKLDVPAYLRKDVKLNNVPHSSEPNISKYNLNDENQILGNNKFLHDNVD